MIEIHLDLQGIPLILSDTAGIRDSTDEIEKTGVKLAIRKAEDADLIIILLDPKNLDFKGFFTDQISTKSIIAINKCDLGNEKLNIDQTKIKPIKISIKKNKNIDNLINEIKFHLKDQFLKTDNVLITRSRHREHLKNVIII